MSIDQPEMWYQAPLVHVQNENTIVERPAPDHQHEKVAPDDLLLFGMMLYMEQGLTLEWLRPDQEKEKRDEAEKKQA